MTSSRSKLWGRIQSRLTSLREFFGRTPRELPTDPFGEPPRESEHNPNAYQAEAAKAPAWSTIHFH